MQRRAFLMGLSLLPTAIAGVATRGSPPTCGQAAAMKAPATVTVRIVLDANGYWRAKVV